VRLTLLAGVALALGAAAARPGAADARRQVAQVQAPAPSAATDQAQAAIDRDLRERAQIAAQRDPIAARYEGELREIDRLKRQKASWRRDRQLRAAMSASLETARRLEALAARLREVDARLARARRALLTAIDAELAAGAAEPRRARLVAARRAARAQLGADRPHKIVLPDDTLDPLADPEELEQQAAALREGEAQLAREIDNLARQADRFRRMSDLRQQHDRAGSLALRDDDGPRRTQPGGDRNAVAGGREDDAPTSPPPPAPPPPSPPPGTEVPDPTEPGSDGGPGGGGGPPVSGDSGGAFDGDPAVVLSEVVDAATVDALRRADRADPKTKAAVAERARLQVQERLRKLREQRAIIERRARELRR